MATAPLNLPYFDLLLDALESGDPAIATAFGRHAHWGYWPEPSSATGTPEDYREAAERLSREICDAAAIADRQAVLDVGCGIGGTIASLNERFSGLELTGLNLDPRQLDRARATVDPRPGNRIQWVEGDACALPFAEASFDAVLAVECIFHFPSRRQFFQEAWRVLKPGGFLALSDVLLQPWFRPAARWDAVAFAESGFYSRMRVRCDLADYRKLAAAVGFQVRAERDITANTLPTYPFLLSLGPRPEIAWTLQASALVQTLTAATLSHFHCLQYELLAYQKPAAPDAP